jgi:hypothetical protein
MNHLTEKKHLGCFLLCYEFAMKKKSILNFNLPRFDLERLQQPFLQLLASHHEWVPADMPKKSKKNKIQSLVQ